MTTNDSAKNDVQLETRVTRELFDRVEALARAEGRSRASVVRRLLKAGISQRSRAEVVLHGESGPRYQVLVHGPGKNAINFPLQQLDGICGLTVNITHE